MVLLVPQEPQGHKPCMLLLLSHMQDTLSTYVMEPEKQAQRHHTRTPRIHVHAWMSDQQKRRTQLCSTHPRSFTRYSSLAGDRAYQVHRECCP